MSTLIDFTAVIDNTWIQFDGDAAVIPVGSKVLLPIEEWVERTELWREHAGQVGVLLEPSDDPQRLAPWLDELALVAIDFPAFTDGRGFTSARLLRSRLGFAGPVRAVGNVIADQATMLRRCGFTEVDFNNDEHAETALKLLTKTVPTYQPGADGARTIPLPGQRFQPKTQSLTTENVTV